MKSKLKRYRWEITNEKPPYNFSVRARPLNGGGKRGHFPYVALESALRKVGLPVPCRPYRVSYVGSWSPCNSLRYCMTTRKVWRVKNGHAVRV